MPNLTCFEEINPSDFPTIDQSIYPDYYVEDCENRIDRLFRYKDCYIEVYIEDEVPNLAIINLGKAFSISQCKEVVDLIAKEYGCATFTWVAGIRNELLIRRLLKSYDYKIQQKDNICQAKFKIKGE